MFKRMTPKTSLMAKSLLLAGTFRIRVGGQKHDLEFLFKAEITNSDPCKPGKKCKKQHSGLVGSRQPRALGNLRGTPQPGPAKGSNLLLTCCERQKGPVGQESYFLKARNLETVFKCLLVIHIKIYML